VLIKKELTEISVPKQLMALHATLDAAVSAAYGWKAELSDEEILERLLKLNLERSA
jgi:hypothetical protein